MQVFARSPQILAQDAAAVTPAASFARFSKVAIVAQLDETRLEAIVVARRYRFGATDLFCEFPGRPAVGVQVVRGRACRLQQLGEAIQELNQLVDPRATVEGRALPVSVEITPLDQIPACPPQSIDGAAVTIHLSPKTAERRTAERTLDAF